FVGNLPSDSPSVTGTDILKQHFATGLLGPTTILMVNPQVDFGSAQGRAIIEKVTDELRSQKKELELADVRTLTAPLGITPRATSQHLESKLTTQAQKDAAQRVALDYYVTALGERTRMGNRLDLVLSGSPFSQLSIAAIDKIKQAIFDSLPNDSEKATN